jgi:hypothetical protein
MGAAPTKLQKFSPRVGGTGNLPVLSGYQPDNPQTNARTKC